jgi:hypothetical protein
MDINKDMNTDMDIRKYIASPGAVKAHPGAVKIILEAWKLTLEPLSSSESPGGSPYVKLGGSPWCP